MRKKLLLLFNIFFLFLATANSFAAKNTKSFGEKIYLDNCAVCHGEDGNGKTHASNALNPKPRDFTNSLFFNEINEERMIITVTEGKPGTAMISWKNNFSSKEIVAVVRYIRKKFMQVETFTSKELLEGKIIYDFNCSPCHGDQGNAQTWASGTLNPPPRNFTDPTVKSYLTKERMFTSVSEGRPQTAMVSWKNTLTDKEINRVVLYIRMAFMRETSKTPPLISKIPLVTKKTINLNSGKNIYEKNCLPCHGINGDGKGPRTAYIFPHPRNFTKSEEMVEIDEERMIKSVTEGRPGTVMISWKGLLTEGEIADVVGYINRTFRN